SLGVGGAEVLLRDTVRNLPEFDHVVCYLHGPETLVPEFKDIPLYCLNHGGWKHSLRTVWKLRSLIRKHRADIVHAHLFVASLLARLALPGNRPFFFTLHNIMSKDAFEVNRMSALAERLTYGRRQHLIAVSQEVLDDYDRWIGVKGPASVLYNYVHDNYFEVAYDYQRDLAGGLRLVAVGNLRRQKNYALLLEAFRLLRDQPVSLDIYGSGDLQAELQEQIDRHRLPVRLMGRCANPAEVLPQYDAYIMASLFEGFGIAPMEAMAAGLPVLLSDLPVFRELAGDLPLYFDPQEPESIARAIGQAVREWPSVREKAKEGRAIVWQKASRSVYFRNIKKIYQHLP
ncbi:MAG TPA: glycosyltransferase, partial [Chitinophagaceae bacterium]|nr:glycosyltransferase [Chitinophagaceae bacterium]